MLKRILDFSPNGEYIAYSSPDGCLKIWETSTNILKQEYTPSSHLSSTCSCVSWCSIGHTPNPSKKSKKLKKNSNSSQISDLQLIAMGTLTGDILLYSYVNADLHSYLSNGHSDVVNDVSWCSSSYSLYSCSNDKNIIVWDIFSGKVKMKWKGDNAAIHSLCVLDSNNLLSASTTVKWWNVEQKAVIKVRIVLLEQNDMLYDPKVPGAVALNGTFTGHASEVFRLLSINTEDKLEKSYFLSSAIGDRVINAWQLSEESNKRAMASFIVSDEPESLSIIAEKDEPLKMSVVCKDGLLHIFEHVLNGRRNKPFQPKFTVQIASKASESHPKPQQVPILCASLSLGFSACLISYGNFLKPLCEKIDLSEVLKDLFLIRDISASVSWSQEDDVSRIKHADKSEPVKLLAPGHMMPVKDMQTVPQKRKKKEVDVKELPMEERLRALDLSKIPTNLEEPSLKADSMVHLLLQGLQSKDNNLLNTVLQSGDERIIQNTLKRLPLQSIILLLKELQRRLNKQEQRNHPSLKWMKSLLSIHLPYLMSCKDIDEYLGPISQLIEARVTNFSKMCQLQGCLKILLSQTSVNNHESVESEQPLAVYQSESDSEESDSGEMDHHIDVSDEEHPHEESFEESSSSESGSEDEMDS